MSIYETLFVVVWGLINFLFVFMAFAHTRYLSKEDKEQYYLEVIIAKYERVSKSDNIALWMSIYVCFMIILTFIDFIGFYIAYKHLLIIEGKYIIYFAIAVGLATLQESILYEYKIVKDMIDKKSIDYIYNNYYKNDKFVESNCINSICSIIRVIFAIALLSAL